ncbi:MAG: tandem-95 repeat protein [Magnetococcus sp. WYHC-3]
MRGSRNRWLHAAAMLALAFPAGALAAESRFTIQYDGSLGRLETLQFGVNMPASTTLGNCTVLDNTTTFSSFENGTAGFAWAEGSGNGTVSLGQCAITYDTAPEVGDFSLTIAEAAGTAGSDLRGGMVAVVSPMLMVAGWLGQDAIPGDVFPQGQPDGNLTIMDALTAFRMVMQPTSYAPSMVADVFPLNDTDGTLNIMDALTIFRAAMGTLTLSGPAAGGGKPLRTVAATNTVPQAQPGTLAATEDTPAAGRLSASDIDGNRMTYRIVSTGSGAVTITNATTGLYTYTPAAHVTGVDRFFFKASDGTGDSNPASVDVTIAAVNDLPTARSGSVNATEDMPFNGTLAALDVDGDPLTYSIVSTRNGSVSLTDASTGAFVYRPPANASGEDQFTFKVNDGVADSNTAIMNVTITAVNDVPVASGGSLEVMEDGSVSGVLSALDADGDALTYSILSRGTGQVNITDNRTGAYLYSPAADATGTDSFTFMARDARSNSTPATVNVTITAVNDVPVAHPGQLNVTEDNMVSGYLSARDADGDALTYSIVSAGNGTVSLVDASTGAYTYTPAANATGMDQFTFRVSDGQAGSNIAAMNVSITAVNDVPVASGGSLEVAEDSVASGFLSASDDDGDALTYSIVSTGSGQVNITDSSTGAYTYIPAANVTGTDSFTFRARDARASSNPATVNVTITASNDAPIANSANLNVTEDTPASGYLSARDADGDTLTYRIVSTGSGTVSLVDSATGAYTYTPRPNSFGTDNFTFQVNDGTVDSGLATVTVSIATVNDLPVADAGANLSVDEGAAIVLDGSASSDAEGNITSYRWEVTGNTTALPLPAAGPTPTVSLTIPAVMAASILTFRLTVTDSANATANDTMTVTVNPVVRSMSIADVTVAEGNTSITNATVVISMNLPVTEDIAVDFATSSTTAIPGRDYAQVNGTVTLPAGTTSGSIRVPVSGDALDEADEVVIVTLGAVRPAGRVTVTDDMARMTIRDDDPEPLVSFVTGTQSVVENMTVHAALALSAPSTFDVSIPYSLVGSADQGTDYTLQSSNPLVIPAGSSAGMITLQVLGDNVADAGEAVSLSLGAPSYAALGNLTEHSVAIVPAPVPRTGQQFRHAAGDDGDLEKGVPWPNPRFRDNSDGTVTDLLTDLIWLKDTTCLGSISWSSALSTARSLAAGQCGLSDGSVAGNWRLPNRLELESLVDYARSNPALPDGHPFGANVSTSYWSSSTDADDTGRAWGVYLYTGSVYTGGKASNDYVWPVRGGQ